jgi:serine/threonine protein kinase
MAEHPRYFGRYRVERELARGGMGVVYLAHDDAIKRGVVVKSIDVGADQSLMERIRREARILGSLNHRHFTRILDVGQQDGLPYLVMERVEGQTIDSLIENNGRFDLFTGLQLIRTIARAIHHAHREDILHCDLTTKNIMVTPNWQPKIMDFGVAQKKIEQQSSVDFNQVVYGAPAYMSPEQIRGELVDCRSDVFALGVITYEILTGTRPFGINAKNKEEALRSVIEDEPLPLSEIVPNLEVELELIVTKALAKDREERYRTADEYAANLERYISVRKSREIDRTNLDINENKRAALNILRRGFSRLFFSLTDEDLIEIIRISSKERYNSNKVIIEEGSSDATLYLIYRGEVSVQIKTQHGLFEHKVLGPGECFGEMTFLSKRPRSASIVTKSETGLIAVNDSRLEELRPEISIKLYQILAGVVCEKLRQADISYFSLIESIEGVLNCARDRQHED